MRFASHFRSSIHVHFTNNDVRTNFGLILNDFVKVNPDDLIGPQLRLSASGVWTVIETNGNHYSGQIAKKELSQDYTLEIEVNGILCTYKINGKEITAIAEKSLPPIKDIMLSFATIVPGGTIYDLSHFTYTPLPGPVLSRNEAIKLVATHNATPYTTVAPGWNCNPDAERWNSYYEPAQAVACTRAGTQLTRPGAMLDFDNGGFGGLPDTFDYALDATFQDTQSAPCLALGIIATATTGIAHMYSLVICSDGTWATKYIVYSPENLNVFLTEKLGSGRIPIKNTLTISGEFQSMIQHFSVNHQLVTSCKISEPQSSMLSLFFSGSKGGVMYSNFSFVPRTQQ